ncbi:MAG: hypothetical protein J6V82_03690, partial [Clostridia bacterium]|nr:hypothetical protein [Clostridia bacterium]
MLFAEKTNVLTTVLLAILTFALLACVAILTWRARKEGGCASCGTRSFCPHAQSGGACTCHMQREGKDELSLLFERQVAQLKASAPQKEKDFLTSIEAGDGEG